MNEFTKEYNTRCTDDVVCPHCLHEHVDSWEFDENEDDTQCHSCNESFSMCRNIRITYSSWKIKDE